MNDTTYNIIDKFQFHINTKIFKKLKNKEPRLISVESGLLALQLLKLDDPEYTYQRFLELVDLKSLSQLFELDIDTVYKQLEEDFNKVQKLEPNEVFSIKSVETRGLAMVLFENFYDVIINYKSETISDETVRDFVAILTDRVELDKSYLDKKDVYELYSIIINLEMFQGVRMFCSSTDREYFVMIPPKHYKLENQTFRYRALHWTLNHNNRFNNNENLKDVYSRLLTNSTKSTKDAKAFINFVNKEAVSRKLVSVEPFYTDAIDALLSIYEVYVDPEHIESIQRQGELIFIKLYDHVDPDKVVNRIPRTLTREEYFNKLIKET